MGLMTTRRVERLLKCRTAWRIDPPVCLIRTTPAFRCRVCLAVQYAAESSHDQIIVLVTSHPMIHCTTCPILIRLVPLVLHRPLDAVIKNEAESPFSSTPFHRPLMIFSTYSARPWSWTTFDSSSRGASLPSAQQNLRGATSSTTSALMIQGQSRRRFGVDFSCEMMPWLHSSPLPRKLKSSRGSRPHATPSPMKSPSRLVAVSSPRVSGSSVITSVAAAWPTPFLGEGCCRGGTRRIGAS